MADRRSAIEGARTALRGLAEVLHQVPGNELGTVLGELDDLAALAGAGRVAVVREAAERGEIGASQARSVVAWTEEHAPSLHAGGAGPVARAVEVCRTPHLSLLTDAVLDATIPVPVAVTVADQYHRIRHRLHPDATDTVLAAMITIGSQHGSRGVRDLRDRLIARYGLPDELQRDHDAAAELIALSAPVRDGALRHYRLTLDTENAAILEAAIGPASRPTPGPDGEPDHRTPSRRRGDAFTALLRAAATSPTSVPGALKTTLILTMTVAELQAWTTRTGTGTGAPGTSGTPHTRTAQAALTAGPVDPAPAPHGLGAAEILGTSARGPADPGHRASQAGPAPAPHGLGAAEVLGTTATGDLLPLGTARRLACDAAIIPAVLASPSQPLDLGRTTRLVTPAQLTALWLRDRHCTFPGCDIPAHWTDAHHLHHWADGGPTSLTNLTLLCRRHHTIAHRDDLGATITPDGHVHWDRHPHSHHGRPPDQTTRHDPAA